ncbi:MAG: hypothetical protein ABL934_19070 [Lysobacteraceae bacterium]|nr:hypothetical protein [Ferruginibacter sp.]
MLKKKSLILFAICSIFLLSLISCNEAAKKESEKTETTAPVVAPEIAPDSDKEVIAPQKTDSITGEDTTKLKKAGVKPVHL